MNTPIQTEVTEMERLRNDAICILSTSIVLNLASIWFSNHDFVIIAIMFLFFGVTAFIACLYKIYRFLCEKR